MDASLTTRIDPAIARTAVHARRDGSGRGGRDAGSFSRMLGGDSRRERAEHEQGHDQGHEQPSESLGDAGAALDEEPGRIIDVKA